MVANYVISRKVMSIIIDILTVESVGINIYSICQKLYDSPCWLFVDCGCFVLYVIIPRVDTNYITANFPPSSSKNLLSNFEI